METKTGTMRLSRFFKLDSISLNLRAYERDEVLDELLSLLALDRDSHASIYKMLKRREEIASTGIGRGMAVPHCRTTHVERLRAAYGRKPDGLEFGTIDEKPVYDFILIVAPPLDLSNEYLTMLGQIADFMKTTDTPVRLAKLTTRHQFLDLLDEYSE